MALLDVFDRVYRIISKKKVGEDLFDFKVDSTAPRSSERFQSKKHHNAFNKVEEVVDGFDDEERHDWMQEYDRTHDPEYYFESDDAFEEIKEESKEEKELVESKGDEEDLPEDQWVLAMFIDPKQPLNKKNLPCFIHARTGSCEYGEKCQYSHDAAVIAKYKAAKMLGRDNVQKLNTPKTILKRGKEYRPYVKPSAGLNRGPGDARRVA
jgi:hypothetical protein